MKKSFLWAIGIVSLIAIALCGWVYLQLSSLPDVNLLKNYRPAAAAEVLDKDGSVLTHYYDRKFRIWTPISGLPDIVIRAVVTAEDDTFFGHEGVNYKAVWEALQHDMQKRRFARGGSTITQQMIKNVLLSREKTITRKIRELVLARKAEEILTKRRILEIYLNEVEWGDNIYGIEAASRYYLDKNAAELSPAESALLAGMLPNPRYYNPLKRYEKTRKRQEQVLFNMQQAKLITQEEYAASLQEAPQFRREGSGRFDLSALALKNGRPCYQRALERILAGITGEHALYRGGGTIRTTLDRTLQNELKAWEEALPDKAEKPADRVTVVNQDGVVRAIVCAQGKGQELQSKFEFLGVNVSGYEVADMPLGDIASERIILPAMTQSPK